MEKKEELFSTVGTTKSDRYLHTPGIFAKNNLLYVQEVGRLESLSPHKCVRENLDSYLFLVVLEGKGSLDVENTHYNIKKGDCALIDCMKHYEHISDDYDAWKLAWIHFNGISAKSYYEIFMKYNAGSNVFSGTSIEGWNAIIGELMDRQCDKSVISEMISGEVLLRLVNRIVASVANSMDAYNENTKRIANKMREFINEYYVSNNISFELESEFCENIEGLSSIFEHYFGITLKEYVDSRRLNAAKELLRFSIKPIDVVAMVSGIGNEDELEKMFKNSEGMSPEEYRAKWAAWIR